METVMKKMIMLVMMAFLSTAAWGYDTGMAQHFGRYFEPFDGKATSKACQFVKAPDFVKALKSDQKPFVIDVRTPAESAIISIGVRDKLVVPMNKVFTPENLSKIPTDRRVVVVCKAGVRAMAIATALRNTGFDNVYVLKGGLDGLAKYLNPKCAYGS
jgi:rhodanese-related sulfurtransferase